MPDQHDQQNNDLRALSRLERLRIIVANLQIIEARLRNIYEALIDHYFTPAPSALEELLTGHPQCIRDELGINRGTFILLHRSLQLLDINSSHHVSIEEQLAIFLYTVVTGMDCVHVGERFQRSSNTITKYFKQILQALAMPPFYTLYVQLPEANSPIPPKIRDDPRFHPFFDDALGAIDTTHIPCIPSAADCDATRNNKEQLTQNCLAACTFDLRFTYFLSGWERSMHDSTLFDEARRTNLYIPKGRYYLADAGFASSDALLVPYQNVQYHHLSEQDHAKQAPSNPKELFNLRHASAHNVVEQIFGVLKWRFRILQLPPVYEPDIQSLIPSALAALHNFIRIYDPDDIDTDVDEPLGFRIGTDPRDVGELGDPVTPAERNRAYARRKGIAASMWEQYQCHLESHSAR